MYRFPVYISISNKNFITKFFILIFLPILIVQTKPNLFSRMTLWNNKIIKLYKPNYIVPVGSLETSSNKVVDNWSIEQQRKIRFIWVYILFLTYFRI